MQNGKSLTIYRYLPSLVCSGGQLAGMNEVGADTAARSRSLPFNRPFVAIHLQWSEKRADNSSGTIAHDIQSDHERLGD